MSRRVKCEVMLINYWGDGGCIGICHEVVFYKGSLAVKGYVDSRALISDEWVWGSGAYSIGWF